MYATYRCPVCCNEMARELSLFLTHVNQHIIDEIKRSHPEWVSSDGTCDNCQSYYREQLTV